MDVKRVCLVLVQKMLTGTFVDHHWQLHPHLSFNSVICRFPVWFVPSLALLQIQKFNIFKMYSVNLLRVMSVCWLCCSYCLFSSIATLTGTSDTYLRALLPSHLPLLLVCPPASATIVLYCDYREHWPHGLGPPATSGSAASSILTPLLMCHNHKEPLQEFPDIKQTGTLCCLIL